MNVAVHKLKGKWVLRDEATKLVIIQVMPAAVTHETWWLLDFEKAFSSLSALHILHPSTKNIMF